MSAAALQQQYDDGRGRVRGVVPDGLRMALASPVRCAVCMPLLTLRELQPFAWLASPPACRLRAVLRPLFVLLVFPLRLHHGSGVASFSF